MFSDSGPKATDEGLVVVILSGCGVVRQKMNCRRAVDLLEEGRPSVGVTQRGLASYGSAKCNPKPTVLVPRLNALRAVTGLPPVARARSADAT